MINRITKFRQQVKMINMHKKYLCQLQIIKTLINRKFFLRRKKKEEYGNMGREGDGKEEQNKGWRSKRYRKTEQHV